MEIWKDIKNYEGIYQVSNYGNVKRLYGKGARYERIIKPNTTNKNYYFVVLCKNGIRNYCRVHRLVAETFIPNPDNLPCVNHKDENKQNNNVENLEWCTIKYNTNYGSGIKRRMEKIKKRSLK